jgi:uncharacterized protein with von Willebrand factor type A (vWA) domain
VNLGYKIQLNDSEKSYFFQLSHIGSDSNKSTFSENIEGLSNTDIDLLLSIVGREALREKRPNLQQLDRIIKSLLEQDNDTDKESTKGQDAKDNGQEDKNSRDQSTPFPIIRMLLQKGYLKDDEKWLTSRGFSRIGNLILDDVMKALKLGEAGAHSTKNIGVGSVVLDTTRKFEDGSDMRLVNIPLSLLNCVLRIQKEFGSIYIPLQLKMDDLEEYETLSDVRASVVYCIDLSSTMKYSRMFGDLSRIEAAKKALWGLVMLNKKYFPNDSIYVVGFGSLASHVKISDIPYLKTFDAGSNFLHYTNYQAAFRLSKRILLKEGSVNKRIILVTDGHPSACFIDDVMQQEKILKSRPYSQFYQPDDSSLDSVQDDYDMRLDVSAGNLVYLCYRYRQVDSYIAEQTIIEAEKCHKKGIYIDTLMISEEDSLLGFVNDMERRVKGRSYYVSPEALETALLSDFIRNKQSILRA